MKSKSIISAALFALIAITGCEQTGMGATNTVEPAETSRLPEPLRDQGVLQNNENGLFDQSEGI